MRIADEIAISIATLSSPVEAIAGEAKFVHRRVDYRSSKSDSKTISKAESTDVSRLSKP
jgi:hypothetical protein